MNQFIVHNSTVTRPEAVVRATMGISLEALINAIKENRNGEYDFLYTSKKEGKT